MFLQFFELGNKAFNSSEFYDAVRFYKKALEIDPNNENCMVNYASALFEIKEYELSIEMSNTIIGIKGTLFYSNALFNRGNCYQELNQYENAETDFTHIIEMSPYDSNAYYNRANARDKLNKAEEANKDRRLSKILAKKDYTEDYRAPKPSDIQDYSLDNFNQDKNRLIEEIKNNPNSYILYFELGNAYAKIREFEKAIIQFEKAANLYTGSFYKEAYQNMIAASLDMDNFEKVISLSKEFLMHFPDDKAVKDMKEIASEYLNK